MQRKQPPPVPVKDVASPSSRPRQAAQPLVEKIDEPVLTPGTIIDDKYRVIKRIAAGGMGEIYAVDTIPAPGSDEVSQRCALKTIKSDSIREADREATIIRFGREFDILSKFQHPNILRVYDYGILPTGDPYFTMELLEGNSLLDIAKRSLGNRFPWEHVIEIVAHICDGLEEIHKKSIHRDLKPGNVFLTKDGEIQILDFGLAIDDASGLPTAHSRDATVVDRLTSTNIIVGTPEYIAPEVFRSKIGIRAATSKSDMYSIGVMMYRFLSGDVPFSGEPAAIITAHAKDEPVPKLEFECSDPTVKERLIHVVSELLSRNPDLRPDPTELKRRLRSITSKTVDLTQDVSADELSVIGESQFIYELGPSKRMRAPVQAGEPPVLLLEKKKPSSKPPAGSGPSPAIVGVGVGVIATVGLLVALNSFKAAPERPLQLSQAVQDAAVVDAPHQASLDSISYITPVGGDVRMFAVESGGIRRLVRTISDGATVEYPFHTSQVVVFEPTVAGRLINGARSIRVELDPNNPPTVRLNVTSRQTARPSPSRVIRTIRPDASATPREEEPEEVPEVEPAE